MARLYVAYPDPNSWTYSGIMGGLAFVQTKTTFYFRIVDLMVRKLEGEQQYQKKLLNRRNYTSSPPKAPFFSL